MIGDESRGSQLGRREQRRKFTDLKILSKRKALRILLQIGTFNFI